MSASIAIKAGAALTRVTAERDEARADLAMNKAERDEAVAQAERRIDDARTLADAVCIRLERRMLDALAEADALRAEMVPSVDRSERRHNYHDLAPISSGRRYLRCMD